MEEEGFNNPRQALFLFHLSQDTHGLPVLQTEKKVQVKTRLNTQRFNNYCNRDITKTSEGIASQGTWLKDKNRKLL